MRVCESGKVLQPIAQNSVESDMGEPDRGGEPANSPIKGVGSEGEDQGAKRAVGSVVDKCGGPGAKKIARQAQVRREEANGENEPTAAEMMIGEHTTAEINKAFEA